MNNIINNLPIDPETILDEVQRTQADTKAEYFTSKIMETGGAIHIDTWGHKSVHGYMDALVNKVMSSSKLCVLLEQTVYIVSGHIHRSLGSRIDIHITTVTMMGTERNHPKNTSFTKSFDTRPDLTVGG